MKLWEIEKAVLQALDIGEISSDLSSIAQVPSVTGEERAVVERLGEMAESYGLESTIQEHDLEALRKYPDYPGEETPRDELLGLTSVLGGKNPEAPRVCLNGHVDVVNVGTAPWDLDPWSGSIRDGFVHGRGTVDMKGGVISALHAIVAVRRAVGEAPGDIVLQAVSSEEDGGAGTFAALERDSNFAACIIPEPTSFKVCCAQAGSLTFQGTVPGVSAHAAMRLQGISAIDRYIPIHEALRNYERRINSNVENPLMALLELPYPVLVGRLEAGQWSSQVPDMLRFKGRVGVRIWESLKDVEASVEEVILKVCPEAEITWNGGRFASAETPTDDPLVEVVRGSIGDELDQETEVCGVPYGADMRLFAARGVPCVMAGTNGLGLAHAVNERVSVEEVYRLARVLARCLVRIQFGDGLLTNSASVSEGGRSQQ